MKTKIPAARLELVTDKNGDIVWEPRKVPLMRDTLGITKRAELARRAMAAPLYDSPRLPPPAMADFDLLPNRWQFLTTVGLAVCAWIILLGIGMLVWAFV